MKLETLLPLIGVIMGWSLKTVSDYLTQGKEDTKRYRIATFYVLRIYQTVSADVVWYKTIPDSFWYRPLNIPRFEVLKSQSAHRGHSHVN